MMRALERRLEVAGRTRRETGWAVDSSVAPKGAEFAGMTQREAKAAISETVMSERMGYLIPFPISYRAAKRLDASSHNTPKASARRRLARGARLRQSRPSRRDLGARRASARL